MPVTVLPKKTSFGLFDKNKYADPIKETIPAKTENNFRDFIFYPTNILLAS